jgi:hypothetical protein
VSRRGGDECDTTIRADLEHDPLALADPLDAQPSLWLVHTRDAFKLYLHPVALQPYAAAPRPHPHPCAALLITEGDHVAV